MRLLLGLLRHGEDSSSTTPTLLPLLLTPAADSCRCPLPLPCRYDAGGAAMAAEALSRPGGGGRNDRRITLAQIKEEGLGMGEKPDWVTVCGGAWWGGGGR